MSKIMVSAIAGAALLTGCAGLSDTEQRVLTGTAAGTAGGAAIGALAGDAALGAGIGAAAGLAGSYLFDRHIQAQDRAYEQGLRDGRAGR